MQLDADKKKNKNCQLNECTLVAVRAIGIICTWNPFETFDVFREVIEELNEYFDGMYRWVDAEMSLIFWFWWKTFVTKWTDLSLSNI